MKTTLFATVALLLVASVTIACSNSITQDQYDEMRANLTALQTQIETIQGNYGLLVADLDASLQELRDSLLAQKDRSSVTRIVAADNSLDKNDADYLCDGTDDNVEIQAAINSLPSDGGEVRLLEGLYTISSPVTLFSKTTLSGQGWNTVLKLADEANCDIIQNADMTNGNVDITVRDVKLDGNKANNPLGLSGIHINGTNSATIHIVDTFVTSCKLWGIDFENNVSNSVILSCVSTSNGYHGMTFDINCSNNMVAQSVFSNNDMHGIITYPGSDGNTFSGCVIADNARWGIGLTGDTGNKIVGCIIKNNGSYGVIINTQSEQPSYSTDSRDHEIIGNTIEGNGAQGIYFNTTFPRIASAQVIGNLISANGFDGIYGSASYSIFSDNRIIENNCAGLRLEGSYNIIVNNSILNNSRNPTMTYSGIELIGASLRNIVTGNLACDDQDTSTQVYGIVTRDASDYNIITSNICYGNSESGIWSVGNYNEIAHNMT